jgi:hypothetical protein
LARESIPGCTPEPGLQRAVTGACAMEPGWWVEMNGETWPILDWRWEEQDGATITGGREYTVSPESPDRELGRPWPLAVPGAMIYT